MSGVIQCFVMVGCNLAGASDREATDVLPALESLDRDLADCTDEADERGRGCSRS